MSAAGPNQSDAAYCAILARGADFERYAATLFVAPEPRRGMLALFAFNVEIARIREQITQPLAGEIRLQWWSDLLAGLAHGEAAGNPVAAELLRAIARHALPQELLERIIEAHRFDLYDEPMQAMTDLEGYLRDTASSLFALAARVLGGEMPADEPLIRRAGLAFGLTRIIEAMSAHAARGKIYLPLEELDRAGVAADDILAGRSTVELKALLRNLAEQARQHRQLALEALEHTPARAAFLPLALIDRKLQRIAAADYEPFKLQSSSSNLGVLWTLWRASRRRSFRV